MTGPRYPDNMSGRLVGQTLKMLAALSNARRVLEIGMFTGYAALSIAEALPEYGEIICCESNPRAIAIAEEFFCTSGIVAQTEGFVWHGSGDHSRY